jgi:hypothetical protein
VLVKRIGSGDAEHLRAVLAGKPHDSEFRAVDVKGATGLSHVGAGKLIRRLVDAAVVAPVRESANSTYFRIVSRRCDGGAGVKVSHAMIVRGGLFRAAHETRAFFDCARFAHLPA